MSGKRSGMMQNCVMGTAEDTWEDDDNGGLRDAGWWRWKTNKAGRDGVGKVRRQICATTGTTAKKRREVRERIDIVMEEGG